MSAGAGAHRLSVVAALMCAAIAVGAPTTVARAAACPNESLREREASALALPDCRAYEQVSPVEKNLTDAAGNPGVVQAAPSGEAVSYFSVSPFPGTVGSSGLAPTYLSTRSSGGWSTAGLLPQEPPGSTADVRGLSEDLDESVLLTEEPSESGTLERDGFIFDTATDSRQLIAPSLGARGKFSFVDASSDDSHILFESKAHLTPEAASGVYNLYEWNAATGVKLAGILPDGEVPEGGSVAGPGGPAAPKWPGGSTSEFYTQDTISEDGARVFFTVVEGEIGTEIGTIYMREPEASRTVQISAGDESAYWRAATPSGSFVLYTEGEDLYRFNVDRFENSDKHEPEALAEAREPLTQGAAAVQGTLGMSNEGSYVYFVAEGVLANNENGNKETAEPGADNLYEWHEDLTSHGTKTTFIAKLVGSNAGLTQDEFDWRGYYEGSAEGNGPSGGEKSSRVTPDGMTVLFSSAAKLTDYQNAGNTELYLYDAERPFASSNLACISCNPADTPAASDAYLTKTNSSLAAVPVPRNAFLTRNLSDDGNRVFFQTEERLLPAANGQMNVYEWERAGAYPGEPDSCEPTSPTFESSSGGCLYLISTGQSDAPSYFGDASASGDDAFFFTRQSLVGQDRDDNVDLYDARVDGGIAAQNPPPPPVPCAEEACRPPYAAGPVFEAPASLTIAGAGSSAVASSSSAANPKPSRAQQLARALRACRKKRAKKRRSCEVRARKRYGVRKRR